MVEALENRKLLHHGINEDYKFVGYTVDTFSQGSQIVAQYSTLKGYFEADGPKGQPRFDKIEADIESAKAHRRPTEETKIYLISTQRSHRHFGQSSIERRPRRNSAMR